MITEHSGTIQILDGAELTGSWERRNRNSTVAAFVGLLIIGVIYFYAQLFIIGGMTVIHAVKENHPAAQQTFIYQLTQAAQTLKNPMRYGLVFSQFIFMLLPTLWIVKKWHSMNVYAYIRLRGSSIAEVLMAVGAVLLCIPLCTSISHYLMQQLHVPDFLSRINSEIFTSYSRKELVVLVMIVCIAPAICEEVFFRGYIQRTIERKWGARSFIITGIIFGLYHMQPLNLLSLSLLGILFGYLSYRSKSIFPSMSAHFTNNLLAVFSLYRSSDGQLMFPVFEKIVSVQVVAISLVGLLGMLSMYHLATQKNFSAH
jgi:membrane protease YdiL (CAAX protease family)